MLMLGIQPTKKLICNSMETIADMTCPYNCGLRLIALTYAIKFDSISIGFTILQNPLARIIK